MRFRHSLIREVIDRGCFSLFLATLGLVIHRHFWQDKYDPHKCDALLAHGRWLDKAHQNWQAPGCMMHKYQTDDLVACLESRRLVFIGDSTIRQVYWATARKFGVQEQDTDEHRDLAFHIKGVIGEFIWDPYLNASRIITELTAAGRSADGVNVADSTAALMVGGGLWHARYLDEANFLEQFKHSIESISQPMSLMGAQNSGGPLNRYSLGPGTDGLLLLAPVPVPFYDSLSPERANSITPAKIDSLNLYLQQQSAVANVTVAWSFSSMTSMDAALYRSDGLHLSDDIALQMADVILNLRCNIVLRRTSKKGYPMDKTCCNSYNQRNKAQSLILNVSVILLPAILILTSNESKRMPFLPSRKLAGAVTVLGLAISYCYYADRTLLFNKTQKQYTDKVFISLCAITSVLGILSIRRSVAESSYRKPSPSNKSRTEQPVLSRDQTDEWKGWMQCLILIYHYTGASKVLWIYKTIRILVASYIFLSGFGHTVFFYKKADYSVRRCAAVLIRLNLLSCILPYLMRTDYLFYYFAPLISFWYMVIYLTMAIGRSKNHFVDFLVTKIVLSAGLVNFLIRKQGVFEFVFYCLEKTCKIHWDVNEWRFRLQLDSYIVYVGMVCGILYVRMTDALRSHPHENRLFSNFSVNDHFRLGSRDVRLLCIAYAMVTPFIYYWLARRASSKYEYNAWFPYVSPFPILAFVILRNISHHTRNFNSSIFVWMGRHSLETFTLQYHIWLAADTKGLLALGIFERMTGSADGGRRADFIVLTILFLWICWHVAAATQTLTSWIVDPREGRESIGGDNNGDNGAEGLPRTRANQDVQNQESVADAVNTGPVWSASHIKTLVVRDLKVRLGLLVAAMWLSNMVY